MRKRGRRKRRIKLRPGWKTWRRTKKRRTRPLERTGEITDYHAAISLQYFHVCCIKHGICLISYLTDICPLRLIGRGVTAGPPAPHVVAAGEAGHRRRGQRGQSAPTARTLKTHLPVPPTKTPHGPATKSPPRGKDGQSRSHPDVIFMSLTSNPDWFRRNNLAVTFVPSDLPHLAHPNDPGGRAQGRPRNQQRSPAPNQGRLTDLTKNQRKANTDTLPTSLFATPPPQFFPFLRRVV